MNIMIEPNITIVTAFFDIGRGDWTKDKGHPGYLHRPTSQYFDYFKNLAELDNPFIVYTSSDFVEKILEIREGKPTTVISIDLKEKFSSVLERIDVIQNDEHFRSKVDDKQLRNPEYWSPYYVLVNNLKSYFVYESIKKNLVTTDLVAWLDFGYCRDKKTLSKLRQWNYSFDTSKIHLFTIAEEFEFSEANVLNSILGNVPYIIGGGIVGSVEKWPDFYNLILSSQMELLNKNLVDDDQGVYLLSKLRNPDMIQLNYLGKNNWFGIFKKFRQTNGLLDKIKLFLNF